MMKSQLTLLLGLFGCVVIALPPPSYIKPCYLQDPDFNKCALAHGNDALSSIVKGDKKYNLPPLNPLYLPLVDIKQKDFKLTLKNVKLTGLERAKVTDIELTEDKIRLVLHIDLVHIYSTYSFDGKILVLTLQGEGPSNITAVDGDFTFTADLKPFIKKNDTYLKFTNSDLQFKVKRAYFDFQNLLNDDRLGIGINELLNDSWEDVLNDLGTPIRETIATIVTSIVSNILERVPKNQLLPERPH